MRALQGNSRKDDGPLSPYGSDSFDLNESIDARVPMVSRTPKLLSSRFLALSTSSLASVDSVESSLKRNVTFSTKMGSQTAWVENVQDTASLASQNNDSEEIPSDGEYSEDFDDAPGEGPLATSVSYAEDFEESTSGGNALLKNGNRRTGDGLGTSDAYSSNFEASGTAYSDDFETSRLSKSACRSIPPESKPLTTDSDIDKLLFQLASKKRLPIQVCEMRYKLMDLSRTLNQPRCISSNDLATAREVVKNGFQLEQQLEQLEVDLVADERRQKIELSQRNVGRRAARVRADERRSEHERRLIDVERRAIAAEREEAHAKQKLNEVETRLGNSEVLLKLTQEARSDLEKGNLLRDQEIADLRLRSSIIATESGIASKESMLKVKALEEATKSEIVKRDIEVAVLHTAIKAAEQRHLENINTIPEKERRMRIALDEEKLEIAKYKVKLETEHQVRENRFEEECCRALQRNERELAAGRSALDACRFIGDAANQRERERLACLRSSLDAERAKIARNRSALDTALSNLNQDRVAFCTEQNALEPRRERANKLEHRACTRERATLNAEERTRNAIARVRLFEVDVKKREAAANEAKLAATFVTQRAEQMAKDVKMWVVRCKQGAIQAERSRFVILQQQAALARLVVAIRQALNLVKRSSKDNLDISHLHQTVRCQNPHPRITAHRNCQRWHTGQYQHIQQQKCKLAPYVGGPWPVLPPPPYFK